MDTVSNCFLRSNAISSAPGCSQSSSASCSCSAVQVSSPMILRTLLLSSRSCWLLLFACPCKLSAHLFLGLHGLAFRPCLSTAMSTAGTDGATEVCDAILPSMRARHASECVPVPFWHLGQPVVTPNFFTIASVMYTCVHWL